MLTDSYECQNSLICEVSSLSGDCWVPEVLGCGVGTVGTCKPPCSLSSAFGQVMRPGADLGFVALWGLCAPRRRTSNSRRALAAPEDGVTPAVCRGRDGSGVFDFERTGLGIDVKVLSQAWPDNRRSFAFVRTQLRLRFVTLTRCRMWVNAHQRHSTEVT